MITDEEQRWFEHQTDREREREMDRAIAAEKERYFRSRGLTGRTGPARAARQRALHRLADEAQVVPEAPL